MSDFINYWIEFIGDRSVKVAQGQSILSASLQAGIPHYHACGGQGKCSTCRIMVQEGAQYLTPVNEAEKEMKSKFQLPANVRLACQTFVTGEPVSVHRIIRDEKDIAMYIGADENENIQDIGAEKELALFFLDIRDFTPFMQSYLPFDVIHIMRRLFTLFKTCIDDHKGQIIETAGDGLYAVFGIHQSQAQACRMAVSAAHAILNEIEHFNTDYLEVHFNHRFQIGIGLHTGRVIIGNVGLGINNNLTVMGLPVIIASRLQAATKELNNSLVASAELVQLLPPDQRTNDVRPIHLKGVNGTLQVHLMGKPYTMAAPQSV